jgi:hypothetical protein
MIFINLKPVIDKIYVMSNSSNTKKKKRGKGAIYFFAATAITTAAFIYLIKEGQRIKIENELLSYEVW